MKLDYFQAIKRIEHAQGVWLLHGQEPLLEQNLLDAFRAYWRTQDIERQRFDLTSVQDWKQVFQALDHLSLFSSQLAVEVHGNLKPDAHGLKLLQHFLQQNSEHLLLIVMPKQDNSSLKTAFFKTIESQQTLVHLSASSSQDRQHILQLEAQKLALELTPNAWQWLEQHHEHNLLAARNSLIRLSDSFVDTPLIDVEHLQACMQDQSRYSTFDLNDAVLKGDLALAMKIFQFLIATGEPPTLILWSISKEMRLLIQLFEQPQQAQQLGIWPSRLSLYQRALQRFDPQAMLQWPALLLRIDSAIKGIGNELPEQLMQQAIAQLCGCTLFIEQN